VVERQGEDVIGDHGAGLAVDGHSASLITGGAGGRGSVRERRLPSRNGRPAMTRVVSGVQVAGHTASVRVSRHGMGMVE
jgi:hypothetical protein